MNGCSLAFICRTGQARVFDRVVRFLLLSAAKRNFQLQSLDNTFTSEQWPSMGNVARVAVNRGRDSNLLTSWQCGFWASGKPKNTHLRLPGELRLLCSTLRALLLVVGSSICCFLQAVDPLSLFACWSCSSQSLRRNICSLKHTEISVTASPASSRSGHGTSGLMRIRTSVSAGQCLLFTVSQQARKLA